MTTGLHKLRPHCILLMNVLNPPSARRVGLGRCSGRTAHIALTHPAPAPYRRGAYPITRLNAVLNALSD